MKLRSLFLTLLAVLCAAGAQAQPGKREMASVVPDTAAKPVDALTYSYAMGVAQSVSLKQFLQMREGIEEAYLKDAIKGITEKTSEKQAKRAMAYAAGLKIAEMNKTQIIPSLNKQATGKSDTTYIDLKKFNDGLKDGMLGKSKLTPDSAMKIVEQQIEAFAQQVKKLNLRWLADNASKPGVVVLPSGLQYRVIKQGEGAVPIDKSKVEVHYEGTLIDGTVFDSSYKRGKSAEFPVMGVIKGWTEALKLMPVGSVYELFIPYSLAYGERGQGQDIPPFATLIFKVELLNVK